QLLDAARARFEEEEDPLALQKLQEALQIEPDNATALALKSRIENRRSDRQIDNWYRLARQHIDNHAYGHAREALQNVLQLRPQEARALQLLAEVDRQEQEYKKLRGERATPSCRDGSLAKRRREQCAFEAGCGVGPRPPRPGLHQPRERRQLPELL